MFLLLLQFPLTTLFFPQYNETSLRPKEKGVKPCESGNVSRFSGYSGKIYYQT